MTDDEYVTMLNPQLLTKMIELETHHLPDGRTAWQGPGGAFTAKPYERGGKRMIPWKPGFYRVESSPRELVWNVPEILDFLQLEKNKQNYDAILTTLKAIAEATGGEDRGVLRADA